MSEQQINHIYAKKCHKTRAIIFIKILIFYWVKLCNKYYKMDTCSTCTCCSMVSNLKFG